MKLSKKDLELEIKSLQARQESIRLESSLLANFIVDCNVKAACYQNQLSQLQGQEVNNNGKLLELKEDLVTLNNKLVKLEKQVNSNC